MRNSIGTLVRVAGRRLSIDSTLGSSDSAERTPMAEHDVRPRSRSSLQSFATELRRVRARSARISCITPSRLLRIARMNPLSSDDSQFRSFQLLECHEATPDVAHKPRASRNATSCSILLLQVNKPPHMASCMLVRQVTALTPAGADRRRGRLVCPGRVNDGLANAARNLQSWI